MRAAWRRSRDGVRFFTHPNGARARKRALAHLFAQLLAHVEVERDAPAYVVGRAAHRSGYRARTDDPQDRGRAVGDALLALGARGGVLRLSLIHI